jgi:methylmalonyl-CoA mutase
MTLHVRTAVYNKTRYDPYVNMLRTTVEALAGAVGGVESMHVAPFDELLRTPNEFSRRIARNQQLILQKECNLTRLVDPAGGSYYVEYLTDQLGRHAWALFRQVEGQGGMYHSLQDGFPQQVIAQVVEQRAANLAQRRDRLVGTNIYPNLDEEKLAADETTSVYQKRVDYINSLREESGAGQALEKLSSLSPDDGPTFIEAAIEAAQTGATLNQIVSAIHSERDETAAITPLPLIRAAEPFEGLRRASEDYLSRSGHRPQIFLANMGPRAQHKARTDFTIGFYEIGGFELLNNKGFATPEEAAEAALASGAPAMVICSTDNTYPDIVPPLVSRVKEGKPDMTVILAGYPKDQVEAHRATGVDDFIHLRANCYEMNEKLLRFLGVV